jgi:hypothetical protein
VKVIVCGSRAWSDRDHIERRLRGLVATLTRTGERLQLIVGGARGADRLAERIARQLHDEGLAIDEPRVMPADWSVKEDTPPWAIRTTRDGRRYDVRAGHERNGRMLDEQPELVIAFADDLMQAPGTKDCLEQARRRGVATELHNRDGLERTSGAHPALF